MRQQARDLCGQEADGTRGCDFTSWMRALRPGCKDRADSDDRPTAVCLRYSRMDHKGEMTLGQPTLGPREADKDRGLHCPWPVYLLIHPPDPALPYLDHLAHDKYAMVSCRGAIASLDLGSTLHGSPHHLGRVGRVDCRARMRKEHGLSRLPTTEKRKRPAKCVYSRFLPLAFKP